MPYKDLKIIYIHGIDGGPHSTKGNALAKVWPNTIIPDMSKFLFPLAHLIAIYILCCIGLNITICIFIQYLLNYSLIFTIPMSCWMSTCITYYLGSIYLSRALNRCEKLILTFIDKIKPDIIVATSWGSAVIYRLIIRNHWSGPVVMLSPAVKTIFFFCNYYLFPPPSHFRGPIHMIHGADDIIISPESSQEFYNMLIQNCETELAIIPNEPHSLRGITDSLPNVVINCWTEVEN